MKLSPEQLKAALLEKSSRGLPIILKRITPQLAAAEEEMESADLLLIDHTSSVVRRNPAADLLPLADANQELLQNARRFYDLLPRYNVVAGLCGTDPFRLPDKLLAQVKEFGFVAVQNTPSIGIIDGSFREHLENSHISYAQEVALLAGAGKVGFLALGTVFSEDNARQMVAAGIAAMVIHPGAQALVGKPSPERSATLEQNIRRGLGPQAEGILFLGLPSTRTAFA